MKKAKVKKVDRDIVVETLARNEFEKLDDHAMYMILVEGCSGVENFDDESLINGWYEVFGEDIEIKQ